MSRHRQQGWPWLVQLPLIVVAISAALFAVVLRAVGGPGGASVPQLAPGVQPAVTFLNDFVTSDGRVIRHDQGGDIVSEGEAYAMVLAEIANRPASVRLIWHWTRLHLQRPDGLLSYHAAGDGRVLDPQSAADADTLAAYALLRYHGPDAAGLHRDGVRLAAAVLAHETVTMGGRLLLVASTAATASPPTVDPSYLMPPVFRAIAVGTGDARWVRLADDSVRLMRQLTNGGSRLPPDWARFANGSLTASPSPSGGGPPSYGADAARAPVWFAVDCDSQSRKLAASWWSLLRPNDDALTLSLDGHVVNGSHAPLSLVAAAAAARAAGEPTTAASLVRAAIRQAQATTTYYGDAWAAFGAALQWRAWRVDACGTAS